MRQEYGAQGAGGITPHWCGCAEVMGMRLEWGSTPHTSAEWGSPEAGRLFTPQCWVLPPGLLILEVWAGRALRCAFLPGSQVLLLLVVVLVQGPHFENHWSRLKKGTWEAAPSQDS